MQFVVVTAVVVVIAFSKICRYLRKQWKYCTPFMDAKQRAEYVIAACSITENTQWHIGLHSACAMCITIMIQTIIRADCDWNIEQLCRIRIVSFTICVCCRPFYIISVGCVFFFSLVRSFVVVRVNSSHHTYHVVRHVYGVHLLCALCTRPCAFSLLCSAHTTVEILPVALCKCVVRMQNTWPHQNIIITHSKIISYDKLIYCICWLHKTSFIFAYMQKTSHWMELFDLFLFIVHAAKIFTNNNE